jgi:16S rRNA processing protein RimM
MTPPSEVSFAVGRIVGAHGVQGEVKMEIHTHFPQRLTDLRRVYFNDDPTPHRVSGVRFHANQALLRFPDITDRDAAQALRGTIVRIAGSQAKPLEEGEFYHYQLIGLAVYDEAGTLLGTLSDILEAGEVDVYVVRNAQRRELLFPALRDVVLEIDPGANRVVVRPQEWEADEG